MTTRYLSLALLVMVTLSAKAAVEALPHDMADSVVYRATSAAEHHDLYKGAQNVWFHNPALHFDAYGSTYGQLGVYANKRHEEEAFVMQEGNTLHNVGIMAASYRRLRGKDTAVLPTRRTATVVWGEASYQYGQRDNVKWNASADWRTIYPYVLADTLGGDRNTERYTFQGGCATRLGHWTIGEELTFRAEHEWATHDPRMRAIVTDLNARIGVGRTLLHHHFALGGTLSLYKQTNSVEFYREEGKIPEYQMMGLGNWYERFSGTNNSAYYKAVGGGMDVGGRPSAGRGGLLFSASYNYTPYKRILSSLNALPITQLYVTQWQGRLGWKVRMAKEKELLVWLGASCEKRIGDEIIGGEASANEYVVRGYLTMYENRTTDLHFGTMLNLPLNSRNNLGFMLWGGRQRYASSYAYPHSELDFQKKHVGGTIQWQTTGERWFLSVDVACRYRKNVSGTFTTTPDDSYTSPLKPDVASAKKRMVEQCVAQTLASYMSLSCGLHAEWRPSFMDNMGLFAETHAAYRENDVANNKGYSLYASVGITF